jgi:N-acyl-L-homoserine lactone synthetase
MDYQNALRQWAERRAAMRRLRAKGWTLQRIATHYRIKPQRVHAILKAKEQ